jgi:hypothetical protein
VTAVMERPHARPKPPQTVRISAEVRLAYIKDLVEAGAGRDQAADMLGYSGRRGLEDFLDRQGRRDLYRMLGCNEPRTLSPGVAAKLEDAEFLALNGCGKGETRQRAGFARWDDLKRFLIKHDRRDLVSRICENEKRREWQNHLTHH